MATKNYLMIDLNDARSSKIAEVMTNKTCKKIIESISEKELSESEISEKLEIPMNTVGYNIKKLVDAGLIEKSSKFFWSSRGKRVNHYKLSNKKIVISPRNMTKGIVPTFLITVAMAIIIRIVYLMNSAKQGSMKIMAESLDSSIASGSSASLDNVTDVFAPTFSDKLYSLLINAPNSYVWFLIGALVALLVFILINWSKNERR